MPWFVKTETFTASTAALPIEQRRPLLKAHQLWIEEESARGQIIRSGFLVDQNQRPGGGGLLIFEAASYAKALEWVQNDPMIRAGLVEWKLQEWIPVSGDGWP